MLLTIGPFFGEPATHSPVFSSCGLKIILGYCKYKTIFCLKGYDGWAGYDEHVDECASEQDRRRRKVNTSLC